MHLASQFILFDEFDRTDDTFKRNTETDFAFLNRSGRSEIARVREFVAACAARYPEDEQRELVARFRSGDDRHFRSACFELLLHEYLIRQGFALTAHPELPNGRKSRPDFLVTCPDGARLYLEAASASENTDQNASAEAMKALALTVLDEATHPDFFVELSDRGDPKTQPSGRKLRDAVLKWLEGLDWGSLVGIPSEALPSLEWRHEDWVLAVRPIPVKESARGKQRRLIGIGAGRVGWVNTWAPIRSSVVAKSRHYGELDLPLVVAVNVDTFALDSMDEEQALFGEEVVRFSLPEASPKLGRQANGAWIGNQGPRARRSSGAWLFPDLTPYSAAARRHVLYLNPWAHHAVPESFLTMPHRREREGHLDSVAGKSLAEVLDLPHGWPATKPEI